MGSIRQFLAFIACTASWMTTAAACPSGYVDQELKQMFVPSAPPASAYQDALKLVMKSRQGEPVSDPEILAAMEKLVGLTRESSIYERAGVLDFYLYQGGKNHRVLSVSHEDAMKALFHYFTGDPRRVAIARHGAFLFHGSNSSSLLAFSKYGDFSGELVPLGTLEKNGKIAFTGEIVDGRAGVNKKHLSTAFITHAGVARQYAVSNPFSIESAHRYLSQIFRQYQHEDPLFLPEHIIRFLKEYNPMGPELEKHPEAFLDFMQQFAPQLIADERHQVEVFVKRIREYPKLMEKEKELVKSGFPVLYGIRPMREGATTTSIAMIPGEVALQEGAKMNEIRVIYVPQANVEAVKELLNSNPSAQQIAVEPLEVLDSIRGMGTHDSLFPR